MEYTIKKSRECEPNAVIVNGQEVGSVQWSGCYYTKRGRSQGYWFIVGNEDAMVPNHTEKFKTMKSAAESLVASSQV